MNKLYLKSIFAAWLMLCVGVSAGAATTYCGTTITSVNQKHSAAITCSSLGENRYLFEFVSKDAFTSYNADRSNFHKYVNGMNDYHVSKHLTQDGNRLYVEFTSTSVPKIHIGAFFVMYGDGEAQYNIPTDGDFSQVCSSGTKQASDLTLTAPATTILDLQIGDDFTIKYTTSSRGAVTFSSSNTDVAIVSADGVITALAAGTTTITVSQAEDETYNAGSKSFTLSVIESVIDKPQMLSASLDRVDKNNAYVRVSATDAVTPFADLTYDYTLTQGENVRQFTTISATDGILHIKDMSACTEYTLEIWAINKAGKKSENSARVDFTTECETAGLWLSGSMNGWNEANADYQFRKTQIADVYSLTKHLKKGSYVYKLTEGSFDNGKCTTDDHHLILSEDMDVTFYARGVNNFASSADSIFVVGTATSDFLLESDNYKTDWNCKANGKYCEWNTEHTSAIWTGNVYGVSGDSKGKYKIVKIAYLNGTEANMPFVYWDDLWYDLQSISGVSESATKASFVFDLPTLSWSWQEVYGGQCTFKGGAGDGQSHDGGTSLFTKGYNISLYLNSRKDTIFVKVAFLDDDKTATNALFQNYPQRDEKVEVKEWRFNREGETQVFSGKVPVSELSNKADGIIRFGIKFEFDGGLRVTTPEFYYLDGSGCAERDFVIYHHHQTPADDKKGAVESFAGGRILQPIQYKRKLRPDVWETLSIPFEVNRVTVTEGNDEYEIYPQYINNDTVAGEFWLREFRKKEVSAEDFQANWHDIQATTAKDALPKKNVPYIIRVPDDATHYWADKYIVFHGASYQTIDDVYSPDVQTPRATEMFAYSGNNTMKQWQLRSAYVLDNEGIYFESGEKVTLYPFECAVNAEIETTRAMPRLALNRKPGVPTGNTPPTTTIENGSVWSVAGWCAGTFCNIGEYDVLLQRLPAGLYIVRQGAEAYKVYITR